MDKVKCSKCGLYGHRKNMKICSLHPSKISASTLSTKPVSIPKSIPTSIPTSISTSTKSTVYIYTDGACPNNGKINARAGLGIFLGINNPLNVSQKVHGKQTNQVAELSAIKVACEIVNQNFVHNNVIIFTDSKYSINCITEWYKSWHKNNWKNSKGNPVQNKELIQEILTLKSSNVTFEYVKAHQKNTSFDNHAFGNNMADKLAVKATV